MNISELSTEAKEAIDKVIADPRNLNSNSINLYNFAAKRSRSNSYESPLNDAYDFLIDNGFVTSNNPYVDHNKYLVRYTSEGKRLHKAGSLLKFFNKDIPIDQQILNYLSTKDDFQKNRDIQQALGTNEAEFEKELRKLCKKGLVFYEEICQDSFIDCGSVMINGAGYEYLENLKNPQANYSTSSHTIIGNGNIFTMANGDVNQSNISINVVENYNYDSLLDVGLTQTEINQLKEIVSTQKNSPTYTKSIMKWLGETAKQVATKGLTENLPKLIETIGDLINNK